jgi:hypothetical protein
VLEVKKTKYWARYRHWFRRVSASVCCKIKNRAIERKLDVARDHEGIKLQKFYQATNDSMVINGKWFEGHTINIDREIDALVGINCSNIRRIWTLKQRKPSSHRSNNPSNSLDYERTHLLFTFDPLVDGNNRRAGAVFERRNGVGNEFQGGHGGKGGRREGDKNRFDGCVFLCA